MLRRNFGQRHRLRRTHAELPVGNDAADYRVGCLGDSRSARISWMDSAHRRTQIREASAWQRLERQSTRRRGAARRMRRASGRIGRRRGGAGAQGARQSHQLEVPRAHLPRHRAGHRRQAVWVIEAARAGEISWWWTVPSTFVAIVAIGASQHQFGGVIHEGTHYMLFANRKLNELASDWLAAFPILTTTYHYRLHHLAHHQFVNDPAARSRHQPAARERSLARLPHHARRGAVGGAEAAVAAEPLPLHDHARQIRLARHRNAQPLRRSGASRHASGRCAPASFSPSALRSSSSRSPSWATAWRWRSSCR